MKPTDTPSAHITDEVGSSDRKERMTALLEDALAPSKLIIRDESKRHQHHAHARSAQRDARGPQQVGQTHYTMEIISERFDSLRPLARHRLVHEILSDEFEHGLHALSLTLKGSKEA
ncbi:MULTISPECIES: BolA family transcriptional regulator [unclassified Saccharibacter]|uniref:BolA family protein n=1 Tax=unclassified Saccharibacter TaxID=2648722 RepID=UPI00132617E7|nr:MULTISPECIES: BolA family protein [unclassified Saccharibacter]MXV35416.1 BolA/IbaG family iron-sulfur metabolism protein [Saccharibacter sp. EH611]MXV58076.1 BolA/IbaG family iron-sulfur metabolism protein [Saccharibacter sp. EH70]MXV65350.1 BolA/IbaG family iron-sulfur metabolism protein [Saccharibacter sp. EH60]